MKKIIISVALILSVTGVWAEDMTVEEIVRKANQVAYYQGQDGKAIVRMEIIDKNGGKREREFTILRRDIGEEDANQQFYVYFEKPADVRNMVYMVWKYLDRDDDRWMYLPALDLVKRISSSDKRSSFVGSHFVYEDISGRSLTEDTHDLVSTEAGLYEIKCTPKAPDTVEFSYYSIWIDTKTFLPMKAYYYDKQGKKYKEVSARKVEIIQGFPTVVESEAKDVTTGDYTISSFSNVQYDLGIPEDIFSQRYLRKVPRKWIR